MDPDRNKNIYNTPTTAEEEDRRLLHTPVARHRLSRSNVAIIIAIVCSMLVAAIMLVFQLNQRTRTADRSRMAEYQGGAVAKELALENDAKPDFDPGLIPTNRAIGLAAINYDHLLRKVGGPASLDPIPGADAGSGDIVVPGKKDRSMSELLTDLGRKFIEERNYDEAQVQLNRALSLDGQNENIMELIGVTHTALKQHQKAILLYEKLIEKNPTRAEYLNNIAVALIRVREFDRAEHYLEQAVRFNRDFADAHVNLAILYLSQREYAKVVARLYPVIDDLHEHFMANKCLAIALFETGNHDEARKRFEQAINLDPKPHESYLYMAKSYLIEGNTASALGWMRSCAERCDEQTFGSLIDDPLFDNVRKTDQFRRFFRKQASS